MKSNLLKKHAKSFYWASFFLSSNTLDKCSSLYNFCRTLDDIVDDNNDLNAKKDIFSKFKNDFKKITTSEKVSVGWGKKVKEAADKTLLPTVKHSWYLGANIPNKPRVFMPYAGGLPTYTKICEDIKNNNYEGFLFS